MKKCLLGWSILKMTNTWTPIYQMVLMEYILMMELYIPVLPFSKL